MSGAGGSEAAAGWRYVIGAIVLGGVAGMVVGARCVSQRCSAADAH